MTMHGSGLVCTKLSKDYVREKKTLSKNDLAIYLIDVLRHHISLEVKVATIEENENFVRVLVAKVSVQRRLLIVVMKLEDGEKMADMLGIPWFH